MIFSLQINESIYRIDLNNPLDISILLNFNGAQPNAYDVEKASSTACEAGEIVGDTRRGGSCNFEQIKLITHCSGTHTECVGHLTHERVFVRDCLRDAFVCAALISVEPEKAFETKETYAVELSEGDFLMTKKAVENALAKIGADNFPQIESLVVRCLPNKVDKLTKTYLSEIPPFFSTEAMRLLREMNIKHLLVDLPSIDRIFDQGKLSNHRIFWNVAPGSFEIGTETLIERTITELIYAPDEIEDNVYILNLQIAPFAADASPSRPLLFRLKR